jgi:phosphoribosylglycinamide formyltransferase-1
MRVGVLASGSGTNLQALLDAQAGGRLGPARIVVVGVNVPGCGALARAATAGVQHFVVDHRSPGGKAGDGGGQGSHVGHDGDATPPAGSGERAAAAAARRRELFDAAVVAALRAHEVELVVLAGFMRILTPVFLSAFAGRVLNIHPSLLPAFPGIAAQEQALRHGVKLAGCTVHFVEVGGVDSGPIIAQAAVPVLDDDDVGSLRARILVEEHRLLPEIVRAVAEGRVHQSPGERRVRILRADALTR